MPFFDDNDVFNPYAITYPNFMPVDDAYSNEKMTYSYYDAEKYIKYDQEGKILEEGTHRSLLDLEGEYYKMYQNQIND